MYVFLLWSMLIFFFIVWTIHVVIGWKQHTWHSICQGQRKNVHAWLLKMSKAKPVTSSYHKFSPHIFYIHSYSYIISSQVSKLYQCHCMTLIESKWMIVSLFIHNYITFQLFWTECHEITHLWNLFLYDSDVYAARCMHL